jgi:CspA family cold shock protein
MPVGTVKFFNTQKGFGFIQPDDGSKDVFVHISAVERSGMGTLNEGQKVKFDVVSERGKNAAANLQKRLTRSCAKTRSPAERPGFFLVCFADGGCRPGYRSPANAARSRASTARKERT